MDSRRHIPPGRWHTHGVLGRIGASVADGGRRPDFLDHGNHAFELHGRTEGQHVLALSRRGQTIEDNPRADQVQVHLGVTEHSRAVAAVAVAKPDALFTKGVHRPAKLFELVLGKSFSLFPFVGHGEMGKNPFRNKSRQSADLCRLVDGGRAVLLLAEESQSGSCPCQSLYECLPRRPPPRPLWTKPRRKRWRTPSGKCGGAPAPRQAAAGYSPKSAPAGRARPGAAPPLPRCSTLPNQSAPQAASSLATYTAPWP